MKDLLMQTRNYLEQKENDLLAPFAAKSSESAGRKYEEKEHDLRTAFQRDHDRVIHSSAFRRLEYKTQVFVNHEGDHYRTRLTHTLEVSQIAKTLARALRVNEDLTDAIALAHDLGHGPFGHAGEDALYELMLNHGGFEHNQQSLRIIEELEDSYPNFRGLNLTKEVRIGIQKHEQHKDIVLLEAAIVDCADEIAYDCHDLDDGLRSQLINSEMLDQLSLWRELSDYTDKKYPDLDDSHRNRMIIRLLMNRMVRDLLDQTNKNIEEMSIKSMDDLRKTGNSVVAFSGEFKKLKNELEDFLKLNLYQNYRVVRMTDKGKRILKQLFSVYEECPQQLPEQVQKRAESEGNYRALCDYLASMTDRYALEEYAKLFLPFERV